MTNAQYPVTVSDYQGLPWTTCLSDTDLLLSSTSQLLALPRLLLLLLLKQEQLSTCL